MLDIVKNPKLRAEFLRALDLITTTQLTMFLDRDPPEKKQLISSLEKLISESDAPEDPETQTKLMRSVLAQALEIFNDPFANYITPDQLQRYNSRRGGNLLGIGIKYRAYDDGYPVIIGVLLGGPLENAGIKPGHQIINVAGIDQKGFSSHDVSAGLKGDKGSEVLLGMRRVDGSEYSAKAVRSSVSLHYARAEMLEGDIAYIKVSRFGGKTHERVIALVKESLQNGAKGFLLDLRDNPGGSTRAARAIVSIFCDEPTVYCEQYKTGATRELPRHGEKLTDLPLTVLVNEYSMSSSEIVAGALQDYKRALLIGAPTYGKGLIQKVFNMKMPLGGAVRTTIAAYATPAHTLIHGVGVTPDIYSPSAPRKLFAETGSLNISSSARKFKRQLLETRLRDSLDKMEAEELIALTDDQLIEGLTRVKAAVLKQ